MSRHSASQIVRDLRQLQRTDLACVLMCRRAGVTMCWCRLPVCQYHVRFPSHGRWLMVKWFCFWCIGTLQYIRYVFLHESIHAPMKPLRVCVPYLELFHSTSIRCHKLPIINSILPSWCRRQAETNGLRCFWKTDSADRWHKPLLLPLSPLSGIWRLYHLRAAAPHHLRAAAQWNSEMARSSLRRSSIINLTPRTEIQSKLPLPLFSVLFISFPP